MRQLGLRIGQAVRVGEWRAKLAAALVNQPGTPGAEFSLAPAVYMHERYLSATGLLQTGSRVDYQQLFALPPAMNADQVKNAITDQVRPHRVRVRTSDDAARNVRRFLGRMSRFLTVIGLMTLLLGVLGIASALRSFMQDKLDHAAVLRCIGFTPRDVFLVYFVLALGIAGVGSLVGGILGSGAPVMLAPLLARLSDGMMPVDLVLTPRFGAVALSVAHGVAAGVIATMAFTLVPVLRTAAVAPLRVLRRDVDISAAYHWRVIAGIGLVLALGVVLVISIAESDSWTVGAAFTGAVTVSALLLWALAKVLIWLATKASKRARSYAVRQGVANLHRPGNQTVSVLVALGLGMMLLSTLLILERSLQSAMAIERRDELPNLFVIDIQPDQTAGFRDLLADDHVAGLELHPMISARIQSLNGVAVTSSTGMDGDDGDRTWESRMRTREYMVSYRAHLMDSEAVTEGAFWSAEPTIPEASIDQQLAESLNVSLGDRLTLDIQGIPFEAVVTSFREIKWEAVRPNAMIVLSPGAIEAAPRTHVAAFRVAEEARRHALSDRLTMKYPNLTVIDVTQAAQTVVGIMDRVALVFRGLGSLALVTGGVILAGAVAAGRHARLKEGMLLRVLGARRTTLRAILLVEYSTLAALAAVCGWLLAEAVNRFLFGSLFNVPIVVPYVSVLMLAGATIGANVLLSLVVGRKISESRPLELLREES